MLAKILVPCSLAMLMLACDDDKASPNAPAGGKEALLTGSKWKITAHTINPAVDYKGDGTMVTDLFAAEGGCTHDDVDAYTSDHKFSIDEGATKCDPADPQTEHGTWSISAAGDSLFLQSEIDFSTQKGKLAELSASKMVLSVADDSWDDGETHTELITFSAQ